jgi:hypothetical protein
MAALIQGHWAGVEIRPHWRRDAVWGEERSITRNPSAVANHALGRNSPPALLPEHFPELALPQSKSNPTPIRPPATIFSAKSELKKRLTPQGTSSAPATAKPRSILR